ncbi:hypothetical protein EDD28_0054 [Salana multivorans]|uniref:Uncharacterized protein n=1 Tax=Salana multivorans TaxID=120377 RepID=A0A3N2D6U3_9MICO|nr:hypothetical protein EDD28_0054 [Salana multivorans]
MGRNTRVSTRGKRTDAARAETLRRREARRVKYMGGTAL